MPSLQTIGAASKKGFTSGGGGAGAPVNVHFKIWGAGGGGGSENRNGNSYRTDSYSSTNEGGAGSFVEATYAITDGTVLKMVVGEAGKGGGQNGNPSTAAGGQPGGGSGTYCGNDMSGGGGGYTGIFIESLGQNQNGAVLIAGGGGGGAGGPGYPGGQANGGGGWSSGNKGDGNDGGQQHGHHNQVARGGNYNGAGAGGICNVNQGNGASGSGMNGGNGVGYHNNGWGSGGGGGGGWYGGGSGANDGSSWDGGGGGAGASFWRNRPGYSPTPNPSAVAEVTYVSHTDHEQQYGRYGDGSNPGYNSMRMPVGTGDAQYSGDHAYGGRFNTSGWVGLEGKHGRIAYKIGDGSWNYIASPGTTNVTINA